MTRKMAEISGAQQERRAVYPDVLRGFAIFLMLFGHSLQMGSGAGFRTDALYFSDRVYQLIYSFHMPLFMVLSGALFAFSLQANPGEGVREHFAKRFRRLILPVLLWSVLDLLCEFFFARERIWKGAAELAAAASLPGSVGMPFYCLVHFLTSHWFLWAVFFSGALVYLVRRYAGDRVIFHLLLIAAGFFVPDGLNLMMYKFLHPFFVIGYYGAKNGSGAAKQRCHEQRRSDIGMPFGRADGKETYLGDLKKEGVRIRLPEFYERHRTAVFLGTVILFLVLFRYYSKDTFIYVTGYKLVHKPSVGWQLFTDALRFLCGAAGCGVMLILWDMILSRKKSSAPVLRLFAAAGRYSLGIYLLSQYVITGLLVPAADRLFSAAPDVPVIYLNAFCETAAVFMICYGLSALLCRSPVTGALVGRKRKG